MLNVSLHRNRIVQSSITLSLIAIIAAGILLTGCATGEHSSGRPIADATVNQIVEGETTIDQIIGWFGRPDFQTTMGDQTLYTYKHTKIESETAFFPYWSKSDSEEKSDELTIVFDNSGVVKTYNIRRAL